MVEDFFNIFLLISSIHGFIFCLISWFSKGGTKKAFLFINFLVLVISLNNFQSWVLVKRFFQDSEFLRYFEIPWHFLIAIFFYLFLINYLEIEKRTQNLLKIVTITFLGLLLIRLGFYFSNNGTTSNISVFKKYVIFEELLSMLVSITISIYAYYLYKMVKMKRIPSNITDFDNLKWIRIFFRLGLLSYVSWFIPLLITLILKFNIFLPSYYPLRIFTTILIYWLGYQSIIQLRVLQERKYLRPLIASSSNSLKTQNLVHQSKSNKKLGIPEEIVENILFGLDQFEKNKGYTSQNMTLTALAKELNTNTSYLSKIVNHYKETSFTNYLNTLRIHNIIALLEANSIIRKYTIKAIAQEAGFSNSDSFSKAFIKLKNRTPSEFIKNLK